MDDSFNIKLLLLGDPSVGKTTFVKKYIDNKYNKNYDVTIGVDYASKKLNIDNKHINLQIWDTAGQESFRAITTSYFRYSNCALVLFDVTNIDSYNNVEYWIKLYLNMSNNNENSILLVGNKKDTEIRAVSMQNCLDLALSLNVNYTEISVKTLNSNQLNNVIIKLLNQIELKQKEQKSINIVSKKENNLLCGIKKCV